jgi:polar amino acid transport system substrate-binding protein
MMSSLASELAPRGTLRVGIWTVPFFAHERGGSLEGLIPDLGRELARRAGVPTALSGYASPAALIAAFRACALDVTFVGITADRAEAVDFGPVVVEIQTSYLVPADSKIATIAEIDRPGVRIAVPSPSAQEAHLKTIVMHAALLPVPPENPKAALDLLAAGEADAFSHVAPMLAAAQGGLPGSRVLPGSYYNVPIAVGTAKGRPAAVAEFASAFVADVKRSGFVQQAIARAGVRGMVVSP